MHGSCVSVHVFTTEKESLEVLSWEVSLQTAGTLKAAVKSAMFINERAKMVLQICPLLVLVTLPVHDPFLVTCLGLWPQ